jgi:F-type H+-transporting ATPase subunit b
MFDEKFWVAAAFFIVIILLGKKIYGFAINGINSVISNIESRLLEASEIKKEAQEIKSNFIKENRSNIATANKILKDAEQEANNIIATNKEKLASSIESKKQQAELIINELKDNAINQLHQKAIEDAIEKFKSELKDKKHKEKLSRSALESLDNVIN